MSSALGQDPHSELYDVAVVGSGATGGWAAKVLSEAGLKVVLLEAGRKVSPREFTEHMPAYKLEYRNHSPELARTRPIQKACYACTEYNYDWFVNDLENPYTTPKDKPFTWQRLRIVGGRSMVWGRQSYRLSDLDLKAASHDGYGDDWPVSYRGIDSLLRPRREVRRHQRAGRRAARTARRAISPPHVHDLRRTAAPEPGAGKIRPHPDHRPDRGADAAPQRTRGLPLLRSLRTGLRDRVLLQQSGHHRGRRPEERQLHAPHRRHRQPGGHGSVPQPGPGSHLRPPSPAADLPGAEPGGDTVRPGPGIDPAAVQLGDSGAPQRSRQFQRAAGEVPHGPRGGRRRGGRAAPVLRPEAGVGPAGAPTGST